MRKGMHIFCDFDGTIAECDVTDALLEAFAAPRWRKVEADWRAGRIGAAECMRGQVELLGCTRQEMNELLDTVAIDPGFPGFVAACRADGIPMAIVSDGLDYAIHRILARHGLDDLPVYANRLLARAGGGWKLTFPYANSGCQPRGGTCKCALLRTLVAPLDEAVLVGDGASDFCAAVHAADFVLAKDGLLGFCRENHLAHAGYSGFADVVSLLGLGRQPLDAAGRTARQGALAPLSV